MQLGDACVAYKVDSDAIWLLALGFGASVTTGQSQYRLLGIQDGLPNQKVHAIDQDRDGFLWIGTHDGLARYDGSSFKVFGIRPVMAVPCRAMPC